MAGYILQLFAHSQQNPPTDSVDCTENRRNPSNRKEKEIIICVHILKILNRQMSSDMLSLPGDVMSDVLKKAFPPLGLSVR